MDSHAVKSGVGLVVIGRNEGDRLRVCLASTANLAEQSVYVDSGSTDGSVDLAIAMGVEVVKLDMSTPFTAARARNAGFDRLLELAPSLEYVQFVDGDCEVINTWTERALEYLENHTDTAVVCGRRMERFPEYSIYNRLCDLEWDTPVGETKACGGDAMMRVSAYQQVNGFRDDLIAGEEPELCVRFRQADWKIFRLDEAMTLHDAAMTKFSQWWKRSQRAGYAFAEGASIHGRAPEKHWVAEARRGALWGGILPVAILLGMLVDSYALFIALAYPTQTLRIYMKNIKMEKTKPHAFALAFFLVIGKFSEFSGQVKFYLRKTSNKSATLIEYK
ncbi:MAG: glycosyltransferase [Candidatus Sedimenticola sp. (ex Thyasira tokunagai)]